jgi:hypothetical protein
MTPEQLAKLPRFAQTEIAKLRQQVERLQIKNDWLEDENRVKVESSNTVVTEGMNDDTALPSFSRVEFHIKEGEGRPKRWKSSVTVHVNDDGKSVEVRGSDAIVIMPDGANTFRVVLRDW